MTYQTLGVTLKYKPYQETSRLYTMYTKEMGKIEAKAQGSSKIKSKLRAHLEPFVLSHLMIAQSKTTREVIAQSRTLDGFVALRSNFRSLVLGSIILEALDAFTKPFEKDERLFNFLINSLKLIARNPDERIVYSFLFKLVSYLGHKPRLDLQEMDPTSMKLSERSRLALRKILVMKPQDYDKIILEPADKVLIKKYLEYILEGKALNSLKFYEAISSAQNSRTRF